MTRVVRDGAGGTGAAHCRFCGALVIWCITDGNKRMPVDAAPSTDGPWVVWHYTEEEPTPRQRVSYFRLLEGEGQPYTGPRWTSHWATCPDREAARQAADRKATQPQLSLFDGGRK